MHTGSGSKIWLSGVISRGHRPILRIAATHFGRWNGASGRELHFRTIPGS